MMCYRTNIVVLVLIVLTGGIAPAQADSGFRPYVDLQQFAVTLEGASLNDKFLAAMVCQEQPKRMKDREGWPAAIVPRLNEVLPPDGKWTYATYRVGGNGEDGQVEFDAFKERLPERFRIVVYLPSQDKYFLTNEIASHPLLNQYHINLSADGTGIVTLDQSDLWLADWVLGLEQRGMFRALAITLVLELLVVVLSCRVLGKRHLRSRMLLTCLCINVLTLPALWVVCLLGFHLSGVWDGMKLLVVLELIVVVVEGLAYAVVGRAGWMLAPAVAFLANALSFLVGLVIG